MSNSILAAISNIASFKVNDLTKYNAKSKTRVNQEGELLEMYVKDAIAGTFSQAQNIREQKYSKVFAYLGGQNSPPDMIIKNGDAIEVKKIASEKSTIALNSSAPKDVLHSDDPKIDKECKSSDGGAWKKKDIFYAVGSANGGKLRYLFFCQGTCYAAASQVYENVLSELKGALDKEIKDKGLIAGETGEIGRVNKVDPLGITQLRVRGMWQIKNPIALFKDVCRLGNESFSLFAIMERNKYESFPAEDRRKLEGNSIVKINDIKISDPNKPSKKLNAKLISFRF